MSCQTAGRHCPGTPFQLSFLSASRSTTSRPITRTHCRTRYVTTGGGAEGCAAAASAATPESPAVATAPSAPLAAARPSLPPRPRPWGSVASELATGTAAAGLAAPPEPAPLLAVGIADAACVAGCTAGCRRGGGQCRAQAHSVMQRREERAENLAESGRTDGAGDENDDAGELPSRGRSDPGTIVFKFHLTSNHHIPGAFSHQTRRVRRSTTCKARVKHEVGREG